MVTERGHRALCSSQDESISLTLPTPEAPFHKACHSHSCSCIMSVASNCFLAMTLRIE